MYAPDFESFVSLAQAGKLVPVYRRLVADSWTPVAAYRALSGSGQTFLFESVIGGEKIGRYSFLGCKPFRLFEAYGDRVREKMGGDWVESRHEDPLQLLENRLADYQAIRLEELPRFTGGAVGVIGYDTVRYVEHLPNAPQDDRKLPDLAFAFYDAMTIFDHVDKTMLIVAYAHIPPEPTTETVREAYQTACEHIDTIAQKLASALPQTVPQDIDLAAARRPLEKEIPSRYHSNFAPGAFEKAVRKAQDYILAGDIFQVVLSQRFRTETTATPLDIYRALRIINPSPFMFLLEMEAGTLVGASPEIMCRVENREMTVRPLAGTRRRGKSPSEDRALATELLADPKERSEHIMLVDLARNDVGRVAEVGSVKVSELMTVERYSHVMHISSGVTGTLAADKGPFDAIRSALPAGTLSGAPKVRAMEIIDELEPHRRGPYGGAVGYIDFSGNTDTCIALRTMVLQGTTADVQAGAGIVGESDPHSEYQETVNKAMSLLRALEAAEKMK